MAFGDPKAVVGGRLYQLARNWRIGIELSQSRPFLLINLASRFRRDELNQLEQLRSGLRTSLDHQLLTLTWSAVLAAMGDLPVWFSSYARDRDLVSAIDLHLSPETGGYQSRTKLNRDPGGL